MQELRTVSRNVEKRKSDRLLCNHCGKDFATRRSLNLHIEIIHEKLKYYCELCKKEFTGKDDLKNHIRVIHEKIH